MLALMAPVAQRLEVAHRVEHAGIAAMRHAVVRHLSHGTAPFTQGGCHKLFHA
jgi:hypothetical protein